MTAEPQPGYDPDGIDPAWWLDLLPPTPTDPVTGDAVQLPVDVDGEGEDVLGGSPGWQNPEVVSLELARRAQDAPDGSRQQQVLRVLCQASSAMLEPDDWAEPFRPFAEWADGSRSSLPSDLDPDQLALLAVLAPMLDHVPMRARVADIAWTYGDRSDSELLRLAIDGYLASPLERNAWHQLSKDAWLRGVELTQRRGKGEAARLAAAVDEMVDRILRGTTADGFMLVDLGDIVRRVGRVDAARAQQIADHFTALAAKSNTRFARHLERTAQRFLHVAGDNSAVLDSQVRVADPYVAEGDQRIAVGSGAEMAAGHFFEKAITVLTGLPRSYRLEHGIDERVDELRRRLGDNRHATLEAMVAFEPDPIDITKYVAEAQRTVAGLPRLEALVRLAVIHPLIDAEQAFKDARESLQEMPLSRLFGRATYAADGRKVAVGDGGVGDPDEAEQWSAVLRTFTIRVDLATQALIAPALDVISSEHRYDMALLRRLCWDSPTVPQGHVDLWARGLWHGLRGDFPSAVSMLIPQMEQFLRVTLKGLGVNTFTTDPTTGVEMERGLGALLAMDETAEFLGADLRLELRALLIEQEGANLRNDTAHGLLTDGAAWSSASIYAWWLVLRLVVVPVWNMLKADAEPDEPDPEEAPEGPESS